MRFDDASHDVEAETERIGFQAFDRSRESPKDLLGHRSFGRTFVRNLKRCKARSALRPVCGSRIFAGKDITALEPLDANRTPAARSFGHRGGGIAKEVDEDEFEFERFARN